MICTRCDGTGFLNIHQLPKELQERTVENAFKYLNKKIKYKKVKIDTWHNLVLEWIKNNKDHDVQVCDCCGNGKKWYGEPGIHDPIDYGENGPYAYNGGLPECW